MALDKKGKKRIRLIVVLSVIVLLIGGSVVYDMFFKDKTAHITATTIAKADIEQFVSLSGTVKAASSETYFAPAQVTVNKLNIKKGDIVKAGDLLAEFDVDDLKNSHNQAALQYANAKLAYDDAVRSNQENEDVVELKNKQIQWAEDDIDGLNELDTEDAKEIADLKEDIMDYKQDRSKAMNTIISEEKVEQLKNSMNLSAISVNSAKKYLDEGKSGITAGISGVVTELTLAEGGSTSPAAASIVIESLENPVITFSLGKYDINSVKVGQSVTIKIGNTEYPGKVSHIDATTTLEGTSTVVKAEVSFDTAPDNVVLGLETDLSILVAHKPQVLAVPIEALKTDRDGTYCLMIENGVSKKAYVELGSSSETHTEVISGLKEGDVVATITPSTFTEGMTVTVDQLV